MSASTPPLTDGTPAGGYQAGALIVYARPEEVGVALRKDEFDTLCEGGIGETRASRDLYLGAFIGALVGLLGVLVTADSETVWKPEHRLWFLCWVGFLFLIVSGSGVGACIHHAHLKRTEDDSPFSRLKKRLLEMYDAQQRSASALADEDKKQIFQARAWKALRSVHGNTGGSHGPPVRRGTDLVFVLNATIKGKPRTYNFVVPADATPDEMEARAVAHIKETDEKSDPPEPKASTTPSSS